MGFLTQWKMYLDELPRNRDSRFSGKRLDPAVFEKVCFCTRPYSVLTYLRVIDRCPKNKWGNCTNSCMRRRVCGSLFRRMVSREIYQLDIAMSACVDAISLIYSDFGFGSVIRNLLRYYRKIGHAKKGPRVVYNYNC